MSYDSQNDGLLRKTYCFCTVSTCCICRTGCGWIKLLLNFPWAQTPQLTYHAHTNTNFAVYAWHYPKV